MKFKKKQKTKSSDTFFLCFSETLSFFYLFFYNKEWKKRCARRPQRRGGAHPVQRDQSRTGRRVLRRESARTEGEGSASGYGREAAAAGLAAVAVTSPGAAASPIDFSSATNWAIFHGVVLGFFGYPSVDHAMRPVGAARLTSLTGLRQIQANMATVQCSSIHGML